MKNIIKKREKFEEFAAIYRERSDGDWDFVACVAADDTQFPMLSQADSSQWEAMLETLREAINNENDNTLTVWSGSPDWPCVWDGKEVS